MMHYKKAKVKLINTELNKETFSTENKNRSDIMSDKEKLSMGRLARWTIANKKKKNLKDKKR